MDVRIIKARFEDCYNLSILKKIIWLDTYKGIYKEEEILNFDYNYHENKFIKKVNDGSLYLIIYNNETIGYFSFGKSKYPFKDYTIALNDLYLLKEYRHQGIGKYVFDYLFKYCKENKIDKFYTCCNMHNQNAYNFYIKNGGICTYCESEDKDKAKHQYYIEYKI